MITWRHIAVLLNLSAVSKEHNLRAISFAVHEVEANVWNLKALEVERGSHRTMLTSVLLMKLPHAMLFIVTRKAPGEDLDLKTLQTVLEVELVAWAPSWLQPRTIVTPKISLGYTLQPQHFSQGHQSLAEGILLAVTVNIHTPLLITMWLLSLMLADRSWRPLDML